MNMLLNLAQCKTQSPLFLQINAGITERHYLSALNMLISSEWKETGIYWFMKWVCFLMSLI